MTESPGTVGEEVARLIAAVQQWARQAAGAGAAGAGGGVATGSTECRLCPFCQLLSMVKQTNPEVALHVSDATASLLAAVRAMLDARDRAWAARRSSGLEHIDIT